jgi:hypothetical protein
MEKQRSAPVIMFLAPLVFTSCVLKSHDQTKVVGEPCVDGATCGPALMCFVPDHDPEAGTCIEPPQACNGEQSCDCLDELAVQCDTGLSCFGFAHEYTVGCTPGGTFRQLDESCAWIVPCASGLLCLMETYGEPGVCRPQPACLADNNINPCDCLTTEALTACPSGSGSCLVLGDIATLHCS